MTDTTNAPVPPRKGLLSDEVRAEFEARMASVPKLLDFDACATQSKVSGGQG